MKKTARKQLRIHGSPERAFGAQLAFTFRKRAFSNDPKSFSPAGAAKPAVSPSSATGGVAQPPKPPAPITAPKPPAPPSPPKPAQPSLWGDMTANGKRVGLGVLGSVSGTGATGAVGLLSGANKAWNAATPKAMNTSQGWTQGLNQVFDQTADFADNSIKDVVGGLTGDTDYHTSRMQNSLEQGYNAPGVDPISRAIAQTAANTGQAAWTTATSTYGGNAAVNALSRVPGVAAGGQMLASVPGIAPAARATSYALGIPMASNLNPTGVLASQLGQNFVGSAASKWDDINRQHGVDSNYAGLVPMFAAQQGLANVIGDDAANAVNSYVSGRFMQGLTPGQLGAVMGVPALAEAGERLYAGQPAAPQTPAPQQPQLEPSAPSPSIMADTAPPPTPAPAPPPEQTAAVQNSMAAAAQPGSPPEAKQQAQSDFQSFMQQQVDSNPQFKSGATDLMSGYPAKQNSPAAQEFQQHVEAVGKDVQNDKLQSLYAANPNPTPQQAGGFAAQAQDAWNGLGQHGQMMVGLGAPLALAGMAMSLFGDEEGGILPMLMSILGLGMAGLGAAGSGMMGAGAQDMVGGGVRNFANMMGANIPEGNQDLSALLKSPADAVQSATGGWSGALDIKGKLEKAEQLKKLTSMPSFLAIPLLRSMDPEHIKTPQDAQAAYANAMAMRQQLDDPNSSLAKSLATAQAVSGGIDNAAQKINQGINTAQNVATGWWNKAKSTLGG